MDALYALYARLTVALSSGLRREEGQTFTEYAIIVATIAVGVVAATGTLRSAVITALTRAAADI
jgi:Flp pilus assembly pilin Flp